MEQRELLISQLEQFLPRLTSVTKEWGIQPEFVAKLVMGYFTMRDRQQAVHRSVEPPSSLEHYYLELDIMKLQQQKPLLDPEKAYLLSLPLAEGVTPQLLQRRYEEYQMALAQEFLDCCLLSNRILSQFFNLEIDGDKFPALARERERLRGKLKDPSYSEPEWENREEREEALGSILQANREFNKLADERGIEHLTMSLVNAAFDICRIQQNIEILNRSKIGNIRFLTAEDARKLAQPITDVDNRIHHFIYEILYRCGGKSGVMYDLHQLVKGRDH